MLYRTIRDSRKSATIWRSLTHPKLSTISYSTSGSEYLTILETSHNSHLEECGRMAKKADSVFMGDRCKFLTSAPNLNALPLPTLPEVHL